MLIVKFDVHGSLAGCRYIYSDRTPFEKLPDNYFCPGAYLFKQIHEQFFQWLLHYFYSIFCAFFNFFLFEQQEANSIDFTKNNLIKASKEQCF